MPALIPQYDVEGLITGYNQDPYPQPGGGTYENSALLNPASGSTGTNAFDPASGVGSYFNGAAGGLGGSYGGGSVPFSLNPTPTQGSGTTFGMVPGAIGAPPSVWEQEQNIPGMPAAVTSNMGNINSELAGTLSPTTTENLENSAAARGLTLGQGGNTGLVNESLLKTLGLTQEELQQAGATNLNQFLSTSGQQQQNPALLAEIADSNAKNAAAPNPTLAAEEAIALGQGGGIGSSSSRPSSATQKNSGYSPTNSGATTGYAALLQQYLAAMNPASGGTSNPYATTDPNNPNYLTSDEYPWITGDDSGY